MVKEFEGRDVFIKLIRVLNLLDHLTKFCSRLHTVDAVDIPKVTKTIFSVADDISQFRNEMEAAQQKSKRTKLVIHDEYMHVVELKMLPQSGDYETETQEWSKLPDNQKTCTEWKATFREAYIAKRRAKAAREGEEKPFGGSAVIGGSARKKTNGQLRRRGYTSSTGPA